MIALIYPHKMSLFWVGLLNIWYPYFEALLKKAWIYKLQPPLTLLSDQLNYILNVIFPPDKANLPCLLEMIRKRGTHQIPQIAMCLVTVNTVARSDFIKHFY